MHVLFFLFFSADFEVNGDPNVDIHEVEDPEDELMDEGFNESEEFLPDLDFIDYLADEVNYVKNHSVF